MFRGLWLQIIAVLCVVGISEYSLQTRGTLQKLWSLEEMGTRRGCERRL